MTLDPLLIEVLACPEDKGPLLYFADEQLLFNPRLHRTYPVRTASRSADRRGDDGGRRRGTSG